MNTIYIKIALAIVVGFGLVSCEKESFENEKPNVVHTKISKLESMSRKGQDDPFIIMGIVETQGGTNVLEDGVLKFIEVGTGIEKATAVTDSNGGFSTGIVGGEYVVKCYSERFAVLVWY